MTDRKRTAALDWEDVRYFLALARSGTLSGAARALRVNHATVARRIGALEAALGKVLFDRRADGYGLSPHGQAALAAAMAMEQSALALPESIEAGAFNGVVRLTTIRSIAHVFLIDRLGAFRREHPGIVLEILTDTRVMSLARREADIALRIGRPKDSGLVGRKLADLHYAYYAAPAVADALADGASAPLIAYDVDAEGIAEAAWLEKRAGGLPIAFRANSGEAQAAAARAGFGVAMLPRYIGDTDARLREVPFGEAHPPRELWLLSPRELARTARVRAVLDAVTDILAEHRDVIEGRTHAGTPAGTLVGLPGPQG
ncbi:MAG TPA: LysR family transcriptional regulator [Azospirillaceae bacterium]|nr:LysR family transcriptional regulator [Azospirillaceae bacterium]